MQVVILKLADSAVTLVNVPTEPIDAVKAICPHLELALVEELLLSFTIMIDDANATNLALILEVPAVFYLDELLDPTNPEFSLQLKRIVHHQLLEVNTMLCQIFVKQLIIITADERVMNLTIKHLLNNIVFVEGRGCSSVARFSHSLEVCRLWALLVKTLIAAI